MVFGSKREIIYIYIMFTTNDEDFIETIEQPERNDTLLIGDIIAHNLTIFPYFYRDASSRTPRIFYSNNELADSFSLFPYLRELEGIFTGKMTFVINPAAEYNPLDHGRIQGKEGKPIFSPDEVYRC